MGRRSSFDEGNYEPDWTEEELEEKLAELRARKSQNREHDDDEESEDLNLIAAKRVRILREAGEFEELEDLAKVQMIMDPANAKDWRLIAKKAAKIRRSQRPFAIRFCIFLLKVIAGVFAVIVVVGIISAFGHH